MSGIPRPSTTRESDRRGISPVVGLVALVALTVCLAAVVAVGVGTWSLETGGPTAAFDLTANGTESSIAIEHRSGDPIDVSALSVTVAVEGERLDEQPPVPFVGASGFEGAPDGPFNARADSEWRTGERARIVVAGTNDPEIDSGDSVTVTLAVDGYRVATLETTAR